MEWGIISLNALSDWLIDRYLLIFTDDSFPVAHSVFAYFVGRISHVVVVSVIGQEEGVRGKLASVIPSQTRQIFTMVHRSDDEDGEDGRGVEGEI